MASTSGFSAAGWCEYEKVGGGALNRGELRADGLLTAIDQSLRE